jgi:hypothetical protein
MQILNEVNNKLNIIPRGENASFYVKINDEIVVKQNIEPSNFDRKIDKTLVFGELFTKPQDFCIGSLLGTNKAVSRFKLKNF